jgi:hypothetical protein
MSKKPCRAKAQAQRKPSLGGERVGVKVAAAILGLPPRTVQDLAARGELPGAAKFGRRWTFDLVKLRRFVKARERQTWQHARRRPDVTGGPALSGAALGYVAGISDGRFTQLTRRLRARATGPRASD